MPNIIIDDFRNCTLYETETDGKSNVHCVIDAQPYLGFYNKRFYDIDVDYPLFPKTTLETIDFSYLNVGYIVYLRRGRGSSGEGVALASTNRYYVLALSDTGTQYITNYGQPENVSGTYYVSLILYNTFYLVAARQFSSSLYYKDVRFPTDAWTRKSVSGTIRHPVLETLGKFLYVPDGGPGTIGVFDANFNRIGYVNFGENFEITHIKNYLNQFLAIGARENSESPAHSDYYIFLWSGNPNQNAVRSFVVNGILKDIVVYKDRLFLIVSSNMNTKIYEIYSWNIRLIKVLENVSVEPYTLSAAPYYTFTDVWEDYICVPVVFSLRDGGITRTTMGILFWSPEKNEMFVLDAKSDMFIRAIACGRDHVFFALSGTTPVYFKYQILNNARTFFSDFGSFEYYSNWFVLGKRIKLNSAEIYYVNKPNAGQHVDIVFQHYDEKLSGSQVSDLVFTLNNSSPFSYSRIDLGIICSKFRVKMTSSNSLTNGFIKRIIINYDVLE